jgi:hypothetical protein
MTLSTNCVELATLPLLFVIVPDTVTVYVPVSCGLVHAMVLAVALNVINDVDCVLSADIIALYTMLDVLQYVDPETVNYVTTFELAVPY